MRDNPGQRRPLMAAAVTAGGDGGGGGGGRRGGSLDSTDVEGDKSEENIYVDNNLVEVYSPRTGSTSGQTTTDSG